MTVSRLVAALSLVVVSAVIAPSEGRPYRAAVASYAPLGSVMLNTPSELLTLNLVEYGKLTARAASAGADIVVFPEYGITSWYIYIGDRVKFMRPFLSSYPALNSTASPSECSAAYWQSLRADQLVFTMLSCYARQNSIYVVANAGEVVYCDPGQSVAGLGECADDGAFHFNTNVVFDRTGRLIARYRKTHLFLGEPPGMQTPEEIDYTTFQTDFGVEFGTMICFDIMFPEPSNALCTKGITNFAFPTDWVNEPGFTAVQVQERFSRNNGVNLLASNYFEPSEGGLGCGIWTPNGPVVMTDNPEAGTELLIGDILQPDIPSAFNPVANVRSSAENDKMATRYLQQLKLDTDKQKVSIW